MKPIVFLVFPAHGHVNPTLPVVRELTARGRRVVYFCGEEFRENIEEAGAEFRRYAGPGITGKNVRLLWNPVRFFCFLIQTARKMSTVHLREISRLTPACLVYDSLLAAGKIIAVKLNLPHVSSVTIPVFSGSGIKKLLSLKTILTEFGRNLPQLFLAAVSLCVIRLRHGVTLDPFTVVQNEAPLTLVYTSRFFQPGAESLGEHFCFVGPNIAARPRDASFPLARLAGKKVVTVSFGTILHEQRAVYRTCIKLLKDTIYQVVLVTGPNHDRRTLEPVPRNFIIRERIPQLEVLERTGVFLTHGGMNSVQEALYYGVPLIVFPQTPEQEYIADRVEELGAGVRIRSLAGLEAVFRHLPDFLDADAPYRRAAAGISRTLRDAGGYRKAADLIVRYGQSDKQ